MRLKIVVVIGLVVLWNASLEVVHGAQETAVPPVIQFSGVLRSSAGQALTGVQGVQFALYSEQEGGAPLWIESQNVAADEQGRFAVLLGSATPGGLPVDLFASGASRWLGVQPQSPGEAEQPRVLLVSVPYALKAADAETIGGLPPSAFVLAADAVTNRVKDSGGLTVAALSDGPITAQANSGSAGFIGKFFNTTDLDNSALFQSGSSIGLGTTTPSSALHIQGASNDGITLSNGLNSGVAFLSFKRADGSVAAKIGGFLGTQALVFDANGVERMRIAPSGYVGIGTSSPIAQLHVSSPGSTRMLFQGNAGTTGAIGLDMDSTARKWTLGVKGTDENGAFILYDFTAGQRRLTVDSSGRFGIGTFTPSTALEVNGAVTATAFAGDGSALTNVAASSGTATDLTCGSPCVSAAEIETGAVTTDEISDGTIVNADINAAAAIDVTKINGAATLGVNTFVGTQTLSSGNLALPVTTSSAGQITLGGNRFLHGFGTGNAFVGLNSGNFTLSTGSAAFNTAVGESVLDALTTGANNTAVGYSSLGANSSGGNNTAVGSFSLTANSAGSNNVGVGGSTLLANGSGGNNTAVGVNSLNVNSSGSDNAAVGYRALSGNTTGARNTAIGERAGTASEADFANRNITGSNNTFIGYNSGPGVDGTSTPLTNATAIGAEAVVSQDNSLVLGSINGLNGATSDVNVGIGTAAPKRALEVNGGVQLNTAKAKPTCDAAARGTFWVTQGGAGVQDSVEVCAKDSGDAYAWRTLY